MENNGYNYRLLTLDLTVARNLNVEFTGICNMCTVYNISDENANLKIKFDNSDKDEITLKTGDEFDFTNGKNFTKVFISNDAVSTGTAILIFTLDLKIRRPLRVTADSIETGGTTGSITIDDTGSAIPVAPLDERINLYLYNNGSNTIDIGFSGITYGTGIPLKPDTNLSISLKQGVILYGICDTGLTSDLRYMEGK